MKILTITNMFPTEEYPDFGTFVFDQVRSIERLGHEVDVLFMNPKDRPFRYKAYPLGFPRLWRTLSAKRYDVIHAHYVYSGIVGRAQRSTPLVLTHHGCEIVDSMQGPLCRLTRSWADETIVVAPWMIPVLGLGKAHVIPCGIDLVLFTPMDRSEARVRLGLRSDRKYAMFAGRTSDPVKRFDLLQEAVERARKTDPEIELLVVAGEPHERMPLYMSAADVFVLSSETEGSPQVVKEAMACNLPIVATEAGDAWTVIESTRGCYKSGSDPQEIASCILEATSPTLRTEGRGRVEGLGIDSIARRVEQVYEAAISKRATARYETRTVHA